MASSKSTEVAVAEKFEIANVEELSEIWAEELDGIEGVSFERVKIPSGGGVAWEIPGDRPDDPEIEREIVGIIIDDHPTAALWLDKKENRPADEDDRPDASSPDGKVQVINEERIHKFADRNLPMPHEDLKTCPYNQFGSVSLLGEEGKGKATKNMHRLFILREGAFLPILVTLPPTSLSGWRNFKTNRVVGRGHRTCGVVVKLTLKKESGGGNDYSVVQFEIVEALDAATSAAMKQMREDIRPLTRRVEISDGDYNIADEGAIDGTLDSRPVEAEVIPDPEDMPV